MLGTQSREIKVNTVANLLSYSILLHQLVWIHANIIHGPHDLMYPGLYNESDILQIRMRFEHMDASLQCTLHRGNKHILYVQSVCLASICLCLRYTDWM